MVKLLQKYKMWILVVFGVLMMIAFLLGDFLRQAISYSNETARVFTMDGTKVTRGDWQRAAAKIEGLRSTIGKEAVSQLDEQLDPATWLMNAEEVRRAGLYGGPADGRAAASQIAQARTAIDYGTKSLGYNDWRKNFKEKNSLTDEQFDQRMESFTDTILQTMGRSTRSGGSHMTGPEGLAEFQGIRRLQEAYYGIPRLSEARLVARARELGDQAKVQYVWVPVTDALTSGTAAPTQAELESNFATYKDTEIGQGQYGMGLRQPDRISYSYVVLNRTVIDRAVTIDPVDIQKKILTDYKDPSLDPAKVRETAEMTLRAEKVTKAMAVIEEGIKAEILLRHARLADDNGYKALPDDPAARTALSDLLACATAAMKRANESMGLSISAAAVYGPTKPQTMGEVNTEFRSATGQGIGAANVTRGNKVHSATAVLFQCKELAKSGAIGAIPAQVGVPIAEPFHTQGGDTVFFVINEVKPAASPAGVDDVRATIETNVKKHKAIDAAKKLAEERLPMAIELGMDEVVRNLKTIGFPDSTVRTAAISKTQGVTPFDPNTYDPAFVNEVLLKAGKIDPSLKIEKASAAERTWVATVPGKLGAAIVQITEYKPMSLEEFQALGAFLKTRAEVEELVTADKDRDAWSREAVAKRLNVADLTREKEDKNR